MAKASKTAKRAPGKLVRLIVNHYRTVLPGTELWFDDGINVILGKNGTGKTTLLQLISKVLRSDFHDMKNEAFDLEYEYTHEHGRASIHFENTEIRPTAQKRSANENIQSEDVPSSSVKRFVPKIRIELQLDRIDTGPLVKIEINQREMSWKIGQAARKTADVHNVFAPGLGIELGDYFLASTETFSGEQFQMGIILRGFGHYGSRAYRFDEALDVFRSLSDKDARGHSSHSGPTTHTKLSYDMDDPISTIRSFGDLDTLFIPPNWAISNEPKSTGPLEFTLRSNGPLSRFSELAGFSELSVTWSVDGSEPIGDELWWTFGPLDFHCATRDGVRLRHDALSYGQKRLLTFLYYLENNYHFVVADELVNGMHYEWIRECVKEIGHRQAFLTSQNPLLLDFLSFDSPQALGGSLIQCRSVEQESHSGFQWKNLDSQEAVEIFDELEVGIQYLNELLRARGLW